MEHNNFSSTDSSTPQTNASGSTGTTGGMSDQQAGGIKDRARELAGNAQEKLADVGSTVRERAGNLKDSLADALETGADKLRQRGQSGQLAGSTGSGTMAMADDGRMGQMTDRVAGGMEATADWLRDADLDGLRTSIEQQVKEHPGRTLLIAAGLGYLLGKALRK
jgi:ElaB/YqjD/DUF883 family membrane-anchored ribosome-binding protein